MTLNEQYNKLKLNYNGLTKKHATALEELKRLRCIEDDRKTLKRAISRANEKIERITQSNKHLRERLGWQEEN